MLIALMLTCQPNSCDHAIYLKRTYVGGTAYTYTARAYTNRIAEYTYALEQDTSATST